MQRSMADRHLLDLRTNTEGERDRSDDIEAGQRAEELIAGTHRGILAGRRLAQQLAADGHDRMRIPFSDLLRRANGFAHEPIRLIEIGSASCRQECVSTCRSRWSPYH